MINTSTLQTLRRVADATSPQGDVLAMPPFEATPVPLYVEGWKGGLDCVHAGAPWSIPLFEMTVGRLTAVTGDGKPGFDRENPKRNVYELHLVPDDPAQLTPLKRGNLGSIAKLLQSAASGLRFELSEGEKTSPLNKFLFEGWQKFKCVMLFAVCVCVCVCVVRK